ncbi:pleckstrin homology domain-containing family O member 1-like isoform X2 [Vanacampus margaritifer]
MLGGPPDADSQTATTTKKKNKHSDTHTVASILSCQADKAGWLRRFCGKGMFREIWKNRFVVLKDHQLMVCEKEGRAGADEVLDLSHFGSCDDVRNHKKKSRSKKNLSKFTLQRCRSAHNTVTANEAHLCHLTRDRARIRHGRRPPSRGHLLVAVSQRFRRLLDCFRPVGLTARVLSGPGSFFSLFFCMQASSSDGTVILDLIDEDKLPATYKAASRQPEESPPTSDHYGSRNQSPRFAGTVPAPGKSQSLPREAAARPGTGADWTSVSGKQSVTSQMNRCSSMDEISSHSDKNRAVPPCSDVSASVSRLRRLISLKVAQTERLLAATQDPAKWDRPQDQDGKGPRSVEETRAEVCSLLKEALEVLEQARQVLREVKELREVHFQLDQSQDRKRPDVPT